MKKITVSQIMKWQPCYRYPKARVKELIGRGKTPLEILDLKLPKQDISWVATHILSSNRDWINVYYDIFDLWRLDELSDTQYQNRIIKAAQKFLKEKAS